jgi:hypothetical protein
MDEPVFPDITSINKTKESQRSVSPPTAQLHTTQEVE